MRPLLLLVSILVGLTSYAQDSTVSYSHHHILKFDLSALVDPDRTIQLGLEFPLAGRTTWQTMAGYGWHGLQGGDLGNFQAAEVWRLRNEVRFYTNRYRFNPRRNIAIRALPPLGNYWALELLTKQVNIMDSEYELIRNPVSSSSAPIVLGLLSKQRYVAGLNVKWGRQIAIPSSDNQPGRVLLDMYLGVGIRGGTIRQQTRQPDYREVTKGFYDRFDPSSSLAPSILFGLKMGFGL